MTLRVGDADVSTVELAAKAVETLYGVDIMHGTQPFPVDRHRDPASAQVHATLALVSAINELRDSLVEGLGRQHG